MKIQLTELQLFKVVSAGKRVAVLKEELSKAIAHSNDILDIVLDQHGVKKSDVKDLKINEEDKTLVITITKK